MTRLGPGYNDQEVEKSGLTNRLRRGNPTICRTSSDMLGECNNYVQSMQVSCLYFCLWCILSPRYEILLLCTKISRTFCVIISKSKRSLDM